jgi:hypothetical protein
MRFTLGRWRIIAQIRRKQRRKIAMAPSRFGGLPRAGSPGKNRAATAGDERETT